MTKSYEMEQKGIRKNFIYQNVNKKTNDKWSNKFLYYPNHFNI
ncbi:hypothetical protein M997_3028 [Proteus hauseri ATCC 700826]|uniref:Uncharacterized protein n=1 Tax=Proteus hauseri ATCC 700826 TaxID=1354271 RepID=A0AAJ3LST4_PROHU|nr:hypothetical protein M997_3028 [Proteus hauseri ATCC 700826]